MKKVIITTLLAITFSLTNGYSQSPQKFITEANSFLSTYVSNGKVDYKAIKSNPSALDNLMTEAKSVRVETSQKSSYQAFWINAYNISVIKGIIDNYPIKSPLDKKGFFDKITYDLGGTSITLNDIENKLLRAKFPKEARFHFVLVCAGLGCPPIINEAYTPAKLESQLQRQAELALNNPSFIKVKGKKVQLSQIFEWYKGDFTHDGNEIDYINKFRKEPIASDSKIGYYKYDWRLNSK